MGENASDALKIVAIIGITCLLIALAFGIYKKAASSADIANEQIDEIQNAIASEKYDKYDEATVLGSEVLSAISTFKNSVFCVQVVNGSTTTEYGRMSSDLSQKADGNLSAAKNKENVATTYIGTDIYYTAHLMYSDGTIGSDAGANATVVGVQFVRN